MGWERRAVQSRGWLVTSPVSYGKGNAGDRGGEPEGSCGAMLGLLSAASGLVPTAGAAGKVTPT